MVGDRVANEAPVASLAALAEAIERDLSELALSLREPNVARIDPAPLIDAARRLSQIQGALLLINQEGLAALTQLVRDQLITSSQQVTTLQHTSYLIVQRFQGLMRRALTFCLRGQILTAAELLRYWHQQIAIGGPSILQPAMLVALDIDRNALEELPPPEGTDQPPPDPDQSLLTLLRAKDDLALREAAQQIAALFAQAAAGFKERDECYYWQALQACLLEYSGVGGDAAPIKKIAAAGVRLFRQRDHHTISSAGSALRAVTREALFELVQRSAQTTLARAVVKLFRIEQQFAVPSDGIARDPAIDEGLVTWTSALDALIAKVEANPSCIVDPAAWYPLVDVASTWVSLSPVANPLKDLVTQIASQSVTPNHAEGIAAGLYCLRDSDDVNTLRAAIQTTKQLMSSTEPGQFLQQLGQWSGAEGAHRLFLALASAMRSDMTQVEHLLDAEPSVEAATTLKVAVAVLTRIAGALRLLDLTDERERVIQLRDALGQKNEAAWMDEIVAQQWVLLQTMVAQLPWQKTLQAKQSLQPVSGLDSIFIEEARGLIHMMRDAAAASDIAGMAQAAHTLGGCSATVGLSGLAELSLALESTLEQSLVFGTMLDDILCDTVLTTIACLLEDYASHGVRGDTSELVHSLRKYPVGPVANDAPETLTNSVNPFTQQEAEAILTETLDESVIDLPQCPAHDFSDSSDSSDSIEVSDSNDSAELIELGELGEVAVEIGAAPSPSQPSSSSPSAAAITTATISSSRSDEQDELYEIFKLEAADLLPQLEQLLRQWQLQPDNGSQAVQLLRVLHTLKGSARMAGRDDLGAEFHHAEAEVGVLLQQVPNSRLPAIAALLHSVDFWTYALTQTVATLSEITPTNPSTATAEFAADTQITGQLAAQHQPQLQPLEVSTPPLQGHASDAGTPPLAISTEKRLPMLRVRADRLAQFADTGAEIWSSNGRLREILQEQRHSFADLSDDLSRLRAHLRELEIEAESRVLARARQGVANDFDPLEFDRYTRLHELTRMMVESITDVVGVQRGLASQLERLNTVAAEQLRDLRRQQSELQALRSQPLHSVEARLRHVLRQAAREVGCEVELELHHGSVEIERMLLDRLLGPLEHLMRNSIVHGIEQAQQRLSLGKPAHGRVMISAALTGNELQLIVQDDGRGLDLQRIRQCAVEAGLMQVDDDLDDRALSALIFAPGLSTASEVTALSGRGIGMDAVRAELHALGGQIEVESEVGQGCRFTLRVPMDLASVMVVLVRAGQWRIGLPTALVKQALQIDAAMIRSDAKQQIEWQGRSLPLRHLGQTLGDTTAPITKGRVPVAVLSDGENTIAFQLDAIEGKRELIVKHPGPQLSKVPGLAGASVLADGAIALIIHPFRLPEITPATALSAPPALEPQLPTVLVVDDSLTVRRASQRLLERHGYAVVLARDGVEALAYLGNDRPALILLDIEMPRMDGFELLTTLRDDTRWHDIPVVMITSRMAERHRERAIQLGANAYMGKPYREDTLLALLSEMLGDERSSKIVSDIVTNNPTKTPTNTVTNLSTNTSTEIGLVSGIASDTLIN